MSTETQARRGTAAGPARRRILDTAAALFYAEGIHTIGVDRIIAEAGVAKATFYNHFPAKDELVHAYLCEQYAFQRGVVDRLREASVSSGNTAREALLAIYDHMIDYGNSPAFRGCPFINAAAEYPDPAHPVRAAVAAHRAWFRALMTELLTAADDPTPERTADILIMVRDSLAVGCDLDDPAALRTTTRDLLSRVLAGPRTDA
ncbi:TetR/AcrR family transcriptional regulator [Yinghuangia seranimata]|uniref:TetR/AcrR family transcriptional regulator n=1 Tax=Yinghuangia seranimata TaxID=408067 RepID=UPI00248AFC5D|nr:TetR/AcrR family transcriptional regulator [Yinghuangia seranimata]MDI2125573.1 TetR/AcrR family transcriptional regulator [Yinghuangia seranimata]